MNSTETPGQNRRIRVFVSSTFRDMVEDRNALMTHCWPELRRFCRERQVELVEVDLRWGIAEEQSTRKETLKLCLDEIKACRPFFIGLLGERYGWVPGDDAFTADLKEEQPWLKDLHGRSVTELEILHGVLNNPDMAGRAFFYFRDPVFKNGEADFAAENAESAEKQGGLKDLIRKTCEEKKIPLHEDYSDPAKLAALVLEDLKAAIEQQFPIISVPDPLTKEARDHEAFAEIRRRTYIGRPEYFEALDRHAAGDGGPLVLLGESGSGKSALLANWVERWRVAHPQDFVFQHYIGGTPDSADHWRLMNRLIAEIKRWADDPEDLPKSHDDMLRDFPVWLAKARIRAERQGVRFIIILDALNQLEEADHARLLGWLPAHPFSGPLRLVVSTLPGDTLEAVQDRGWTSLRIQPLAVDERRRMIADYLARFGKKLDASRLERLAAAPAAANPLYLKILLDELRVTGTHDRLDERLGEYLAAPDIPSLLRKMLARYQRDYERDRPGLVGEALGLIWAARRGLTETELLELLGPPGQSAIHNRQSEIRRLPLATWTPLRAALEEGLVDRGGILNFAHEFLRNAVESVFAVDEDKRDDLRLRMADYFEAQPITARTCDELPWLLKETDSRIRLRETLLNCDAFSQILHRDGNELYLYWQFLKQHRQKARLYISSFQEWERTDRRTDAEVASRCSEIGYFLLESSDLEEAETFLDRAIEIQERTLGATAPETLKSWNNLAGVFHGRRDYKRSHQILVKVLRGREAALGPHHSETLESINNVAGVLTRLGDFDEAIKLYTIAMERVETAAGRRSGLYFLFRNNLAGVYWSHNSYLCALRDFKEAMNGQAQLLGPEHPQTLSSMANVARALELTNDFEESIHVYQSLLIRHENVFGVGNAYAMEIAHRLAVLHERMQNLAAAQDALQTALAKASVSGECECLGSLLCANQLGGLMVAQANYVEARPLFERVLRGFLRDSQKNRVMHAQLKVGLDNFVGCLKKLQYSTVAIDAILNALGCEYGIRLGLGNVERQNGRRRKATGSGLD